jgi:hypothetical protein
MKETLMVSKSCLKLSGVCMMSTKLSTFDKVFNNILENNLKFLYFTRGIEFQKQATHDLKSLLRRTTALKKRMIKQKNENLSNLLLSLENLLIAYIMELEMYINLKEDKMNQAWDSLVNAQQALRTAFQAHDIVLKYNGEAYSQKLHLIEKSFFPPQTFNSIEAIVTESECSICHGAYGNCDHIIGKPYMGEICCRIMTKVEFKGLSILTEMEPASKHHRITEVSEDGYMKDILTWRIVEPITINNE